MASIASLASAIPVKRGLFDNISHFPFLASSSSAHGSSSSSSSSDHKHHDDFHHDSEPDYHSYSHLVHHPEDTAISYQNQYFGHEIHHDHDFGHEYDQKFPTSYQHQHLFDNHLPTHDFNDFKKYEPYESLLEHSQLDAPEYGDYKNYGGDLAQYSSHHAGLLDLSDNYKIDHLLVSPNHSSYDSPLLDSYSPHSSYDSSFGSVF